MDPHEEAFDTVRTWWRAWVEKDLEAVRRLVGPEYTELSVTKHLRPKAIGELLDEASRYAKEVSITQWEVFNPSTELFEDRVVCRYCFRLSGRRRGRNFTFAGSATDVLAKRSGRWIYVSHEGILESRHHSFS